MIHASVFSGIGGPEVAAAMLGWENAFHCEINPFGRAVLEYWFPESESYEDITKTDFRKWRGRVDVLTGGFPCQPFSYAGKRGGREDERYLWPEMLRVINEVRPTWVVGENVAGITTMVEGGVLTDMGCERTLFDVCDDVHGFMLRETFTIEKVCKDLEDSGYTVQPMLIPAAAVGAPHRRDRIFIIAHVADSHGGDDLRESGIVPRERGTERLQERDAVREPGESDNLRSQIQGSFENTERDGCRNREYEIERDKWHERYSGPRDKERICGEKGIDTADPNSKGHEESEQSGWGEDSEKTKGWVEDRIKRPCRNEYVANSFRQRLSAAVQSRLHGEEKRDGAERSVVQSSDDAWTQGTWWDKIQWEA